MNYRTEAKRWCRDWSYTSQKKKKSTTNISYSPVTSSNYIFFNSLFLSKTKERTRERENTEQFNISIPEQPSFLLKDCGWINRLFVAEVSMSVPLISDHQEPRPFGLKAYTTPFKSSCWFCFGNLVWTAQIPAAAVTDRFDRMYSRLPFLTSIFGNGRPF